MKQLSLSMVRGAGTVLLNSSTEDVISSIGCTADDWDLIVGNKPWIGIDRARVSRVLDSLLFGMIDTIGLPRFELPAEYVAALVSLFVSPVNYFSACTWLGSFISGDDLANYTGKSEPLEGFERVKPHRIFALVCAVRADGSFNKVAAEFQKRVDLKLAYINEKELANG